jgi:25S rRNA (uracil2634-N3)-methyltransferase
MPAHNRKKGRKRPLPGLTPRTGMVVIGGNDLDLMFSARLQAAANPRQVQSYSSRHKILIVGDGDLTFALSLATALGGTNIVATTFDTRRELLRKYKGVQSTITSLQRIGAKVVHGVDATNLEENEELEVGIDTFQRIVFNFPHIGGATTEDVQLNKTLLLDYFLSSKLFLSSGGETHVTLRSTLFYESWDVVAQAKEAGFRLVRKEPFQTNQLLSYENKRTSGESAMRQAPSIENAKRFRFVPMGGGGTGKGTKRKGTQQQQKPAKRNKPVEMVKSKHNFSISASGSEYLQKRKSNGALPQASSTSSSTSSSSSSSAAPSKTVAPTDSMRSINKESTSKSSKGSKKKKKKKKKTRLSLFQKKEDERVANKDSK